eukprot:3604309-Rhodomonas_salina.1
MAHLVRGCCEWSWIVLRASGNQKTTKTIAYSEGQLFCQVLRASPLDQFLTCYPGTRVPGYSPRLFTTRKRDVITSKKGTQSHQAAAESHKSSLRLRGMHQKTPESRSFSSPVSTERPFTLPSMVLKKQQPPQLDMDSLELPNARNRRSPYAGFKVKRKSVEDNKPWAGNNEQPIAT